MRVAAIDCGTNSIRLYVAEGDSAHIRELDRRIELNRLGQGVDASGHFADEALRRTFDACDQYATVIDELCVDQIRFVATSAARDAGNREAFFAGVEQRLGVRPEVITGEEEARLSFTGALAGVGDVATPALVMDLGGGSTEFVTGDAATVTHAVSLNMGSVRVRERFLLDEIPTPEQVDAATEWIDRQLDESRVCFAPATWIGVAGSVTSLVAIHQGLSTYDRAAVHGATLNADDIHRITERLLTLSVRDIMTIGPLRPRRAEVISAGALICDRVARRIDADLVVSESDILDGIALDLLARGD